MNKVDLYVMSKDRWAETEHLVATMRRELEEKTEKLERLKTYKAHVERSIAKRRKLCIRFRAERDQAVESYAAMYAAAQTERATWNDTVAELARSGATLVGDLKQAAAHLELAILQRDTFSKAIEQRDGEIGAWIKAVTALQTRCNEYLTETRAQRAELETLRAWKAKAQRLYADAMFSTLEAGQELAAQGMKWQARAKRWKRLAHVLWWQRNVARQKRGIAFGPG